jgi:structural maintenance of chromosome 2
MKELDQVIKEKKQGVSDADLHLKKLEHDVQTLNKDKAAASSVVASLEERTRVCYGF